MTNTLFRFVTMRAPEVVATDSKENYFVHHPDPANQGHFKSLVADPIEDATARMDQWRELATSFSAFRSVDELKNSLGSFYDFSNWLAKNAQLVSENPALIGAQPGSTSLDSAKILQLWDNLFYQLITNESAYVRDQVIQVLVANHCVNSVELGALQGKTALSRVVIPAAFYGTVTLPEPADEPNPTVYTRQLQKEIDVVIAKDKVKQYTTLGEELKKIQQRCLKDNALSFNTAKMEYDANFAASLEGKTVIDESTGDTKIVPTPFEPFNFSTTDELSSSLLGQQLTPTLYYVADTIGLTLNPSFDEAFEIVNREIEKQNAIIFEGSSLSRKIIRLNNVILPVGDTNLLPGQQYGFLIKAVPVNAGARLYKLYAAINMGYPNADVVHSLYHAPIDAATNSNGTFTEQVSGNTLILGLYPDGLYVPPTLNSFRVHGDIILANGVTLLFDTTVSLSTGASGQMELKGEENGGAVENFVPFGFGIKRLGIADYRQVEQTTCCYVPGEVSHIENVMAREYKEKSSRRLRRSEDTLTIERQTEKEDLTDTTTTDRYEMQQQTSAVITKDMSSSVNISSNFNMMGAGMTMGSNFAYNTSQQDSNSQAVTYAKDVTQRAQERVVQKVREERVLKIIDEFEEQNKHGFDNRKGNQHVSGVYRWLDKIYKNKIFNYGKRLMYEFLVPQPAVFHNEAMKVIETSSSAVVLEKPVDPRSRELKDHRNLNEAAAASWAAVYNSAIESAPETTLRVSKSFHLNSTDMGGSEIASRGDKIDIPEGYKAVSATVSYVFYFHPRNMEFPHIVITVGDKKTPIAANSTYFNNTYKLFFDAPIYKELGVGIEAGDLSSISYNIVVDCVRTDQHYRQWQLDSFNSIVEGYEKKLAAYNDALAAAQTPQADKEANPLFYRQIENTVLRKNCIGYLVGQNNLGQKFYTGNSVATLQPVVDADMDRYAALVKFIEQAFEWDIISYTFYPFYWAEKAAWQKMYQLEVNDPLFRSFLQSGMARVVVTVRPGFEEAVMHYMATGNVWNGGQVPVIGDDLYLSIVEELKNPTYYVEETWETRVPSTLTVIQSGSIGLAANGLPCCEDDEPTGIAQNNNLLVAEEEVVTP